MKRLLLIVGLVITTIGLIAFLKSFDGISAFLWDVSKSGTWLLPLVIFSAILDSVHPCSFSILLITIAFLFGMHVTRRKILQIGGVYILGIFVAYFLIGIGLLKVLHLFNTPHFMGKLGAAVLIAFGVLNLLNYLFPNFPIKLKIPSIAHGAMGRLIDKAAIGTAFVLGLLVGVCQFPCMGGPYLMVVGLLNDYVTYNTGFLYLLLYNLILIVPLVAVLIVAADKQLIGKVQEWKTSHMGQTKLWAGLAMLIIGIIILFT